MYTDTYHSPFSQGSGIIVEERRFLKSVRVRRGGWLQGNQVFWTQQGSCTYELTVIVTECARPVQA